MTIEEMRKSEKEMLTPGDVSEVLGSNPHTIRLMARDGRLDFPTVIIGNRVKIPRRAFLEHLGVKEDINQLWEDLFMEEADRWAR